MEAGAFQFETETGDLRALLGSVMALAATSLPGGSAQLRSAISPTSPRYFAGDATRIRQVLANLVPSQEVFLHPVPFLVTLALAIMVGTWGIAGYDAQASNLSFFPLGLKAIWTVARGEKTCSKSCRKCPRRATS